MLSHKTADIELVKMDTGDVKSVLEASKVIKERLVAFQNAPLGRWQIAV